MLKLAILSAFVISLFFSSGLNEPAAQEDVSPQKIWTELFMHTPYPFTIPLPDAKATPIDGTYVKSKPLKAPLVHCRRCPDWAPEAGDWKINFSKGVYRIIHYHTTWHGIGTYLVAGDRIFFANDPVCHEVVGVYKWKLENGQLTFEPIDDGGADGRRAANLAERPWISCQPANREAAITEHWPKPPICD